MKKAVASVDMRLTPKNIGSKIFAIFRTGGRDLSSLTDACEVSGVED